MSFWSRREFLQLAASAGVASGTEVMGSAQQPEPQLPTRAITRGPKHHWFGYYDKLQFDPSSRYVLGMQVGFEHRSPRPDDVIKVGMVDLEQADRWIELGESRAWCWQQGCMLQWLPGSDSRVLWNDRQEGRFVCHVLDVTTGRKKTLPHAIYSVSPDGKTAVTADFGRINDVRPGYGYAGVPDAFADDVAPQDSGISRIDLTSGKAELILSLAEIARVGPIPNQQIGIKHYFNHLLVSPNGERFIALHRWRYPNGKRLTRMITAKLDGTDLRIVCGNGFTSHFIWRDPTHILAQSKDLLGNKNWGNFLFEDVDGGGDVQEIGRGVLDSSGHLSYLPGNHWILSDTYPQGKMRLQTPHLYQVASGKRIDLGRFHLPSAYAGEWRVDTHPRFSPNGRYVCIDAPVANTGRQLLLIDIGNII